MESWFQIRFTKKFDCAFEFFENEFHETRFQNSFSAMLYLINVVKNLRRGFCWVRWDRWASWRATRNSPSSASTNTVGTPEKRDWKFQPFLPKRLYTIIPTTPHKSGNPLRLCREMVRLRPPASRMPWIFKRHFKFYKKKCKKISPSWKRIFSFNI